MEAINIIGVLCLILTFFATIGLFILWRFSNILFQLEHDRVYKVEKLELENKALWLALENLGVTERFKEMALRNVEAELDEVLEYERGESNSSLKKRNSPRSAGL